MSDWGNEGESMLGRIRQQHDQKLDKLGAPGEKPQPKPIPELNMNSSGSAGGLGEVVEQATKQAVKFVKRAFGQEAD